MEEKNRLQILPSPQCHSGVSRIVDIFCMPILSSCSYYRSSPTSCLHTPLPCFPSLSPTLSLITPSVYCIHLHLHTLQPFLEAVVVCVKRQQAFLYYDNKHFLHCRLLRVDAEDQLLTPALWKPSPGTNNLSSTWKPMVQVTLVFRSRESIRIDECFWQTFLSWPS